MRVLVLGGTGFIGPAIVQALLSTGHDVAVFHRGTGSVPGGVHEIVGNRDELSKSKAAFEAWNADVVVHDICFTERQARDFNAVLGDAETRRIVLSSADVYRAFGRVLRIEPGTEASTTGVPVPLDESSPLRVKRFPYRGKGLRDDDYEKIFVEEVVLEHPRTTVLRLPMVYGRGDHQHRLFPYAKRMKDERPAIFLSREHAEWRACRAHVDDVAHAVRLVAESGFERSNIYNVAHPDDHTEKSWVEAMGRALGWKGRVEVVEAEQLPVALRFSGDATQSITLDSSALRRDFGFSEITNLDDRLRSTMEWELAHPPEWTDEQFPYALEDDLLGL